MLRRTPLVLCAIMFMAAVLFAQTASVDAVKALVVQGEYQKAIAEADRVLRAEGDSLTDAQVYSLQMLKAESLLQSKRVPQAVGAYFAAMQVAPDLKSLAAARAGQTLLGRVQGTQYLPKTGTNREAIDVLDASSRKKAMAALAADLAPQYLRSAENALGGNTLTAAEEAFLPLLDLYAIQFEAGVPSETTLRLVQDLTDHVHRLLTTELDRVARQVRVADRSSSMYDAFSNSGRRGLTSKEREDLSQLSDYIEQIQGRLLVYRQAARRLQGKSERWDTLYTQYSTVRADLDLILKYASA